MGGLVHCAVIITCRLTPHHRHGVLGCVGVCSCVCVLIVLCVVVVCLCVCVCVCVCACVCVSRCINILLSVLNGLILLHFMCFRSVFGRILLCKKELSV